MYPHNERLAAELQALMDARPYSLSPGLLAKLSGVPKGTIVNWLESRVTKPRRWQDVVMVADALRLDADEADRLLAAAGQPLLGEIAASASPADRPLLMLWIDRIQLPRSLHSRPATAFVGRDGEVRTILGMLNEPTTAFITLIGPGGVGKSRLALEVAHAVEERFADGVAFVRLGDVSQPGSVLQAIAVALGLNSEAPGIAGRIRSFVSGRQILLVLDDAEPFADSMPEIRDLFEPAMRCRVIVTSRSVLRVTGERQLDVKPLSTDRLADTDEPAAAVALFLDRARRVDPEFALTRRNARTIAEICRRLDGLPLSIELAAARIKVLSPAAILRRLHDRLGLLTWAPRDSSHRSLRDVLDWSFRRLTPTQQDVFVYAGAFPAGFTIDAIDRAFTPVCDSAVLLDTLMALADCSLMRRTVDAEGMARHGLLDTMREYALDQATQRGRHDELAANLMLYVDDVVSMAASRMMGAEQRATMRLLDEESANLTAALRWATDRELHEWVVRVVSALWPYWLARGKMAEGRGWLAHALTAGDLPQVARGWASVVLGRLARHQGDIEIAETMLRRGLDDAQQVNDEPLEALALGWLGVVAYDRAEFEIAHDFHTRSLQLRRRLGDEWGVAATLANLAEVSRQRGDDGAALALQTEARDAFETIGDQLSSALSLTNLGHLAATAGDAVAARRYFTDAIERWIDLDERCDVAEALEGLAGVDAREGSWLRAAQLLGAARRLRVAAGTALSPVDVDLVAHIEERAIEHLGAEAYGRAARAGALMPLLDLFSKHDNRSVR